MVSFRNPLSHAYDKFNRAILKDVIDNRIEDFTLFVEAVNAHKKPLEK